MLSDFEKWSNNYLGGSIEELKLKKPVVAGFKIEVRFATFYF